MRRRLTVAEAIELAGGAGQVRFKPQGKRVADAVQPAEQPAMAKQYRGRDVLRGRGRGFGWARDAGIRRRRHAGLP